MKKKIVWLSIAVGLLILAFIIYSIGPDRIWQNIKKLTWQYFLILIALRILYWILRTINWKVILDEYDGNVSLPDLFMARMCGHAVNQLTPTAQVGSELARILVANCSSKKLSAASVIVDKTIELLSGALFITLGVTILFAHIALPVKLKFFFIGGGVLFAIFILFIFSKQQKGLLVWVIDFMGRIKIRFKFVEKAREKIKETDAHISEFYRDHRRAFLKVFFLYVLLTLFWVTEIHLNLMFMGVKDISFVDSFLVTILGNLAYIFFFVPGSLGISEATYVGLFALLGMGTDVGLSLVLMRRILGLLLAGFGLGGMLKSTKLKK